MDATSNLVSTGADLAYLNGYGYGGRYGFGNGREWANESTNQHTAIDVCELIDKKIQQIKQKTTRNRDEKST